MTVPRRSGDDLSGSRARSEEVKQSGLRPGRLFVKASGGDPCRRQGEAATQRRLGDGGRVAKVATVAVHDCCRGAPAKTRWQSRLEATQRIQQEVEAAHCNGCR